MEIRDIESSLAQLRDSIDQDTLYESSPVVNTNSWDTYKFMFVRRLDQDEYR